MLVIFGTRAHHGLVGLAHGGKLTRPTCNGGGDDKVCDAAWNEYNRSKLVPIWMIAPLTFVSILFAFVFGATA